MENLNILIVESSSEDAERIQYVLDEGGLCFDCLCVSTETELHKALTDKYWDVILSSSNLPGLNAKEALSVLSTYHLDAPFIVLSSHAGEEAAGALMDM